MLSNITIAVMRQLIVITIFSIDLYLSYNSSKFVRVYRKFKKIKIETYYIKLNSINELFEHQNSKTKKKREKLQSLILINIIGVKLPPIDEYNNMLLFILLLYFLKLYFFLIIIFIRLTIHNIIWM